MIHLRHLTIAHPSDAESGYPFSVPAVKQVSAMAFPTSVTCFVGENGSGKSTLLEGIAAAAKLPAVGSEVVDRDPTLADSRRLASAMQLEWAPTGQSRRGFFLRAEDFFGFTKTLTIQRAELVRELAQAITDYAMVSEQARALKLTPLRAAIASLDQRYGMHPDASSLGESFLTLFRERFVPNGLYLLDEPEAPLSPTSQLAMLPMLKAMVDQGAQFIIATHSPILLAYPEATIWSFDDHPPRVVPFDELEHVRVTRDFLSDRERHLRQLLGG